MALDVKTMCLGALAVSDASGYELQKRFKEGPFGHFLEASYGSIYPALNRLTEEGLVSCLEQSQEGRPDKKTYSITQSGRDALGTALSGTPAEDRYRSEFLFFMSFADLMSPDQIRRLIDNRIEEGLERQRLLAEDDGEPHTPGQEFVRGYGKAMIAASLAYLEENRHILENQFSTQSGAVGGLHASMNQKQ